MRHCTPPGCNNHTHAALRSDYRPADLAHLRFAWRMDMCSCLMLLDLQRMRAAG
jgi:hypothetical protein